MDGLDEIGYEIPENLHEFMPPIPRGWGWFVFCPNCQVFEALTEDEPTAASLASQGYPLMPVNVCMN